MPDIRYRREPDASSATFTALATPSSGATRNAAWRVRIEHGEPGVVHRVSDEETFVCLGGRAVAQVGGARHELSAGGALIVPPETEFALTKVGTEPFEAVVVLPVGATAQVGDGAPFTPPWAVGPSARRPASACSAGRQDRVARCVELREAGEASAPDDHYAARGHGRLDHMSSLRGLLKPQNLSP